MSALYNDANILMVPSGVKDGTLYSVLPHPEIIGQELITNTDFATDASGWTLNTGVTYNANGYLDFDGTTLSNSPVRTTPSTPFVQGKVYKVSFEIKNYDSGTIKIRLSGGNNTIGQEQSGNGIKTQYVTANDNSTLFDFINADGFIGSIDNVSIKEADQMASDFTFSRGSNLGATRTNAQGLIEKGRENILLQSNQFDTTPWDESGVTAASGYAGYDGTNDAWRISKSVSNGRVQQSISGSSGVYTFSVYAKKDSRNYIMLNIAGPNINQHFNIDNGTVQGFTGTAANKIDAQIESVGNDWYRCSVTFNAPTGFTFARIYPAEVNDSTSGTDGRVFIQDSQLEVGLVATDYIETGVATAQAGILEDMPRLDYSGGAACPVLLVESQKLNVITHSEYIDGIPFTKTGSSIDTNVTTSPEGLTNASLLKEDNSNGTHFITEDFTLISSSNYAVSVFAKSNGENRNLRLFGGVGWSSGFDGNFDLTNGTATGGTIEDYGNGWYRCSVTGTTSATTCRLIVYSILNTTSSYQGDGSSGVYLYGLQIEQGSFQTSYIPTHGASVTRSADFFENKDLDELIGTEDATFFIDFDYDVVGRDGAQDFFEAFSTGANTLGLRGASGGNRDMSIRSAGIFSGTIDISSAANTSHKVIIRVTGNLVDAFYNGAKLTGTITGASTYAWSVLRVTGDTLLGKVKQISAFDTALSDSECINLTTV